MKAQIIGAGIGGLATALCLKARGWDVSVLEKSSELAEVGAGLQIPPNAMHVFGALGLSDALERVAVQPTALEAVRADGRPLFSIPLDGLPWGAPYLHIHRADYVAVLADALRRRAPRTLSLGVDLKAEDIPELSAGADLVVAADGVRSQMKEALFAPGPPRWTGNVAWRATVPTSALRTPPPVSARVWMGQGCHAVTYRLRGGDVVNLVGVVEQDGWEEEGWNIPGERAESLADFSGFASMVTDILERSDTLHKWALFDRDAPEFWSRGNVALLGDAAHPMLPFMAQGAAMAVEDAWVLADAVTEAGVEAGLEAYQARRSDRVARVVAVSRRNAELFHLSEQKAMIAHAALRVGNRLAPGLIRRRFDWLYGFDPTA